MQMRFILLLASIVYSTSLLAEDDPWGQCGTTARSNSSQTAPNTESEVDENSRRVHLFRIEQDVHADSVIYSDKERKATATGNVLLRDPELEITSEQVEYWIDTETARAEDVRYWYFPAHGSGTAESVERVSQEILILRNGTYSTCDFEQRDWEMKSRETVLDRETGVGTARDVTVKFKGIPIFYTPWINYAINNERKTGFLAPVVGNSGSSGFEVETPFYWNIAPNQDATISQRYLSQRGTQFNGQYRNLGENRYSQLDLQFLNDRDDENNNLKTSDDNNNDNDNRYLVSFEHRQTFSNHLSTSLIYNNVSDDNYFEDLSNTIGLTSTQRLERRGDLVYNNRHLGGSWNALLRFQDFEVVDDTILTENDPFARLPQARINNTFKNLPAGLELSSIGDWTYFEHEVLNDASRAHGEIQLSRPWTAPWYFIKPSMRLMTTQYSIFNAEDDVNDNPSRTLPSFQFDSGLIFERENANNQRISTIEPRLFYLYTPDRNQDDIPIFDTGEFEFSFPQLFRNDRFSSYDRISDANQLTLALTSRYLDKSSGHELLRASIGSTIFFADQDVELAIPAIEEDDSTSDIAAELAISPNDRWEAIAAAIYDPQESEFFRTSASIQYRSPNNFVFNSGYRFRRGDFSQTDVSMIYPITQNWRAVGRWLYDFRDKRDLDILGGLEYDTCCWAFRIGARRFTNDNQGDFNNSIEVQLTLKGLTSIGSPFTELLESSIRGYDESNTFNN
jgi:LPS-assembly protein